MFHLINSKYLLLLSIFFHSLRQHSPVDSAIKGGQSRSMQDTKSIEDIVDMSLIPLPSPHRPRKEVFKKKPSSAKNMESQRPFQLS